MALTEDLLFLYRNKELVTNNPLQMRMEILKRMFLVMQRMKQKVVKMMGILQKRVTAVRVKMRKNKMNQLEPIKVLLLSKQRRPLHHPRKARLLLLKRSLLVKVQKMI